MFKRELLTLSMFISMQNWLLNLFIYPLRYNLKKNKIQFTDCWSLLDKYIARRKIIVTSSFLCLLYISYIWFPIKLMLQLMTLIQLQNWDKTIESMALEFLIMIILGIINLGLDQHWWKFISKVYGQKL